MDNTKRTTILAILAGIALAVILTFATTASGDSTHNTEGGDTTVTCSSADGPVTLGTVCAQVVQASPRQYCAAFAASEAEAAALAICGDATAFCNGSTAFSLAVTKNACIQAQASNNTNVNNCPACPSTTIVNKVLKCSRVKPTRVGPIGYGCVVTTEAVQ